MKVEIVRSGGDWIVMNGAGKILAAVYEDYTTGIPHKVTEALEEAMLKDHERGNGED